MTEIRLTLEKNFGEDSQAKINKFKKYAISALWKMGISFKSLFFVSALLGLMAFAKICLSCLNRMIICHCIIILV